MIYKQNLDLIKQWMPQLHHTLLSDEPLYDIKLIRLDNQFNYVIENKDASCFIHSVYDIDDELNMMFKNVKSDCKSIVLFGFGCGYALDYIKKNMAQLKNLCIVEPTSQMFREYLKEEDMNTLVRSVENINFFINNEPETVADLLLHMFMKDPKIVVVFNVSYRTVFKEYFDRLQALLVKKIRTTTSGMVTIRRSNEKWVRNSFHNLRLFDLRIEDIADELKRRPAVIVSAGPSLNKNMHLLNKIKDRALIFAVGSAIKILDSHGIEPHFRIAIDGNEGEKKVVQNLKNENIPLIYSNILYYEIPRDYTGPKIAMVTELDVLGKYIYKKTGLGYLDADTGPSVGNAAFDLLCKAGCKKVIFVGQDMCFTEGKRHAKGAVGAKGLSDYNERSQIKMKDIHGNDVYTITPYLLIKYDLDSRRKKYPDTQVINATEGGLGIKGAVHKPLKQVMEEDLADDMHPSNFILLSAEQSKANKQNKEQMKDAINAIENELEQIININDEKQRLLAKLAKKRKKGYKKTKILHDLQYINKLDTELDDIDFYKYVIKAALGSIFIKIQYRYKHNEYNELTEEESLEKEITDKLQETNKYIKIVEKLMYENSLNT